MTRPAVAPAAALLLGLSTALSTVPAAAAPPTGYLDAANASMVGGWARDPDWPGPIAVHVYIDGEIAHGLVAGALRPDLPFPDQDHGFTWTPPLQGAGSHSVVAYAIGVDAAGNPDGENPALVNSPGTIAAGCAGLPAPSSWWCAGVPAYYANRAADTEYLYNASLRAGVNTSYGGTVFEFYGPDHSRNLLAEHGGGAVQLSVWGYEPSGPAGWFADGDGVCDPAPYPSEAACLAAARRELLLGDGLRLGRGGPLQPDPGPGPGLRLGLRQQRRRPARPRAGERVDAARRAVPFHPVQRDGGGGDGAAGQPR